MKLKKFNPTDSYTVKSTHLSAVSYDRINQALEIQFTSGEVYRYFDVRPVTHTLLKERVQARETDESVSVGEFFDKHIRRNYKYKKQRKFTAK